MNLNTEHISNEEVLEILIAQHPSLGTEAELTDNGILISFSKSRARNIIDTAITLDQPIKRYELIIASHRPGVLSTGRQQMSLTLSKGHSIQFGAQMLTSTPWNGYVAASNKETLSVELLEDLTLNLYLEDAQSNHQRTLSGAIRLEPDVWLPLNQLHQPKQARRHSAPKTQEVWLKLVAVR